MKFALKFVSRFKVLLIVLLISVAVDLVTKWYVFENLLGITSEDIHASVVEANKAVAADDTGKTQFNPNPYLKDRKSLELVKDHVFFTPVLNPGAFSGLLGSNRPLLLTLSVVAVLVLLIIFFSATKITFVTQFLGGVIFAGALGNFYDRLIFRVVRDFVDCRIPELPNIKFLNPWNTFNIADAYISVGVITFMVILFLTKPDKKKKSEDTDDIPELTDITPSDAKYYVVFPRKLDIDSPEHADELAKITKLHQIDVRRMCRKQEGFLDRLFSWEVAKEIRDYFNTKTQGVAIVHIDNFPRVSRAKDITNIEGQEEGLLIDRQKSLDLEPIPWSEINYIRLGIIAGKVDPLTRHINDTLDKSSIFNSKDLTRDEKSKVLGTMLQDFDKIKLWDDFLDEQIQIMDAEELKEKAADMPFAIVNIFGKDNLHFRLTSKTMMPSNLPENRTPNALANMQIMLGQVTQHADASKISETVTAFVQKQTDSDGKSEFKAHVIENMTFANEQDYQSYLRWFTNVVQNTLTVATEPVESDDILEVDVELVPEDENSPDSEESTETPDTESKIDE